MNKPAFVSRLKRLPLAVAGYTVTALENHEQNISNHSDLLFYPKSNHFCMQPAKPGAGDAG